MRVAGSDIVEAWGEIMAGLQKLWRKVKSRDIAREEVLSFG